MHPPAGISSCCAQIRCVRNGTRRERSRSFPENEQHRSRIGKRETNTIPRTNPIFQPPTNANGFRARYSGKAKRIFSRTFRLWYFVYRDAQGSRQVILPILCSVLATLDSLLDSAHDRRKPKEESNGRTVHRAANDPFWKYERSPLTQTVRTSSSTCGTI